MFHRKSLRRALSAAAITLMLASPVNSAFAEQGSHTMVALNGAQHLADQGSRLGLVYDLAGRIKYNGQVIAHLRVVDVLPNTGAFISGLKPGDMIYAVNGYTFQSADDLLRYVRSGAPGTTVRIDFNRGDNGGTNYYTSFRLTDQRTITASSAAPAPAPAPKPRPSDSGITAADVAGAVIGAIILGTLFGGSSSGGPSYGGGDGGLSHGDAERLMRYNNQMSGNCGSGMC